MKKSEYNVIKEMFDELKEARDFYLNDSKQYSINSNEHRKAMNNCSSLCHDMSLIQDLMHRLGYGGFNVFS